MRYILLALILIIPNSAQARSCIAGNITTSSEFVKNIVKQNDLIFKGKILYTKNNYSKVKVLETYKGFTRSKQKIKIYNLRSSESKVGLVIAKKQFLTFREYKNPCGAGYFNSGNTKFLENAIKIRTNKTDYITGIFIFILLLLFLVFKDRLNDLRRPFSNDH